MRGIKTSGLAIQLYNNRSNKRAIDFDNMSFKHRFTAFPARHYRPYASSIATDYPFQMRPVGQGRIFDR
ncbi:hypothetical protein GHA01_11630 [Novacetimonas hansenii]|uniref:Uncharacterized protein n=1 Tax=Novacetimonas hansenii TaxID=436 RepID=A0ABQ0SDI7_NOVHA|nr:hypothetical protein Gaha_0016_020 [Novacetimonas hansenii JCM 7643]GEC63314.1 hypothetical protein GHA01_11630 [Novacetimonas hansenii]